MSILGTGLSGLSAAQTGLLTTGHNISNASTPGYSRQQAIQVSNLPQPTGSGFIGQGVQVTTVRRIYSQYLVSQTLQAQTQSSQLDSYYTQIKQIDNILGDPNSGLSPALQDFFRGVQDVAASPASVPSRQALLSNAQSLTARLQGLNQRFTEIRDGVNRQITESVNEINSLAQQIASLNHNIILAQGAAGGQPPNDLLDQRDALLTQLNGITNTAVVREGEGGLNIFIGNGQALVVGAQTLTLKAVVSPEDPRKTVVGYVSGGSTVLIQESNLQGGALGGYLAFRGTLDSAQNALGRIAISLGQTFNDQHRLGQDLNGALGGNFFTVPVPKVISVAGNNPASSIAASISDVGALTTSDYQLGFDGTTYTLTRLSDNTSVSTSVVPSGAAPLALDGLSITAATINAGERFMIQPTRNGAQDIAVAINDTAKIAAAAPIRTAATLSNASAARISAGSVNSFNDKVVITFTSPTAFDVVDGTTGAVLAKNMTYAAGGNISFNGWTTQIAGAPAAADTFTVDRTLTATTSSTATIGVATLNSPSPVDTFLTNGIKVVFDSAIAFHIEGATNNVTGASSIAAGATFAPALPLATGANPGVVVTNGTATIGTGGAGAYASTGAKVTISGGTVNVAAGIATISGATVTVEGGSYYGSTTFKGVDITINNATGAISIPAAAAATTASTFHGRPATGIAYDSAIPNLVSVNGWTAELTGTPGAGDVFTIGPNNSGIADNRNALLLGGLQARNTLAGGTATYQSAYGQLVSQIGNKTRELEVTSKAQANLVAQTEQAQQSLSGVNLDEEAANLLRYQQAYQASGKVMQIAASLFETLLNLR
jgi:flagellar hook-associated protein 1 FlgK